VAQLAAKSKRRTASREMRRTQLIEATIKCIAKKGLGSTTMANVAQEAGLSQGIVNLHFESKENLLHETLRYIALDYDSQFEKTLANSGSEPAHVLRELMRMDLKPSICDPRKLAVWFAFWGEVKSVPTYRRICNAFDTKYDEILQELCNKIITEGDYSNISPVQVTDALSSMTDGLWLSCLVRPGSWDRRQAMQAVDSYLRNVFPRHYD